MDSSDGSAVSHAPSDAPGKRYTIRKGDTLYRIAIASDSDWRDIVTANPGIDPGDLRPGDVIIIPEREKALPAPRALKVAPEPEPIAGPAAEEERRVMPKSAGYEGPLRAERRFVWPLRGRVVARYGQSVSWRRWEKNRGVDIRAGAGQLIVAAKSGRVSVFEHVPGYGRSVVLDHTDGTTTFYGHVDEVLVPHGRWVRQGEGLASAGSSAQSNGAGVHFRILRGERFIDPLSVLPR